MLTKMCMCCEVVKSVLEFSKRTKSKDGLQPRCKDCVALYYVNYYNNNKVRVISKTKQYKADNKESIKKITHDYYLSNMSSVKERTRLYSINNRGKRNASTARRRSIKNQATPAWSDAEAIIGMYRLAELFNRTGIYIHVDHIVPLRSTKVCGLHCEANLQLLLASDNVSKGNHWWPDMW